MADVLAKQPWQTFKRPFARFASANPPTQYTGSRPIFGLEEPFDNSIEVIRWCQPTPREFRESAHLCSCSTKTFTARSATAVAICAWTSHRR
jgi:hypothetical protein